MIQLTDLLAATGGALHLSGPAAEFISFCWDSRIAQPGQLFVAVKTERADGHDYIRHALAQGVTGVLCERPVDLPAQTAAVVVVPDTRAAVQAWAHLALARQQVEVIGITGSVGKTTANYLPQPRQLQRAVWPAARPR